MILGYPSVAELKDLVAAKDVAMRNLARRFGEVSDSPKLNLATFKPAYLALTTRYVNARAKAEQAIKDAATAWRDPSFITADAEWSGLLSALNPRWKERTWATNDGSFEDLWNQVVDAGATTSQDEPTPQPQSGTDVDFNALTATTHVTQALESTSHAFDPQHLALYALLGGALALLILPKLMTLSMPGMLLRTRG